LIVNQLVAGLHRASPSATLDKRNIYKYKIVLLCHLILTYIHRWCANYFYQWSIRLNVLFYSTDDKTQSFAVIFLTAIQIVSKETLGKRKSSSLWNSKAISL
jgi:uncharacterized protein YhbP (UPF0306 family)